MGVEENLKLMKTLDDRGMRDLTVHFGTRSENGIPKTSLCTGPVNQTQQEDDTTMIRKLWNSSRYSLTTI